MQLSPWYVLVRGLSSGRPTIHSLRLGPPYDAQVTGCGLSHPYEHYDWTMVLPRNLHPDLHWCRRCWPAENTLP